MLPQAKCGVLRDRCRRQRETDNCHLPSAFHTIEHTILIGGTDTIPGSVTYYSREPQRQHRPSPEPAQSYFREYIYGFWTG